ncbi:MAG: S8 family serine peptidase [Candidatus Parabeggiatoa sp.]|nr:S8 family serine peptidase [Candidatus Parabeggiatoa sp.]
MRWIIIALFSILSVSTYAERVLVHLPGPISVAEIAQLNTQAHIIRDLRPLPWLVVGWVERSETHLKTRRALQTNIANITKSWSLYPDVQGHFALAQATSTTPNDPRYTEQWHLTEIGVPTLWEKTQGEGVIIALIDSGVDPRHPDLSANILFDQGYDFGDEDDKPYDESWTGHGTAMAGLIVATCHNQKGGCGVAPAAKIIPYKINQHSESRFLASDLAAAILAAADSPAKILLLSLVLDNYSQIVQDALFYAKAQDKIVVAAAGNTGGPVAYPASEPWVIGVGAFDKSGQRLRDSNYGEGLSLNAPGVDLITTLPGTGYTDLYRGTSPAAALVSGVLALMIAQQPDATVPAVTVTLLASSEDVETTGFDNQSGFGHLKIANLLTTDNEPSLTFTPTRAEVLRPSETLQLNLSLNQLTGRMADLYLRLNLPSESPEKQRVSFFKIWNSHDSIEKIAYNFPLASPYLLTNDLFLPLYGTRALLGPGLIDSAMLEGVYELSARLTFADNSIVQARKLIWVTDARLFQISGNE